MEEPLPGYHNLVEQLRGTHGGTGKMEAYASGNWIVKRGKEAEFIQKWRTWLEWSRDHSQGLKWAKLMRSAADPRHFVSISQWESERARTDWKTTDAFKKSLADLQALTDEFTGGDYKEEVAVQAQLTTAGVIGAV